MLRLGSRTVRSISTVLVSAALPFLGLGAAAPADSGRSPGEGTSIEREPQRSTLIDLGRIAADYLGPSRSAGLVRVGSAEAQALAAGDLDGDGVADLACAYRVGSAGVVAVHRGNVASIFPGSTRTPASRTADAPADGPFLPVVRVYDVPEPPRFLEVGDFDADGRKDVVVTAGHALYLLRGDGGGRLAPATRIDLPGPATALLVADLDRGDGLEDLALGVDAAGGSQLLIFASPRGALGAAPESHGAPDRITSLAVGLARRDGLVDLVATAGRQLLIRRGRNAIAPGRDEAVATVMETVPLPFEAVSLAAGHFTEGSGGDLALMSAGGDLHLLSAPDGILPTEGTRVRSRSMSAWRAGFPPGSTLFRASVSAGPFDDALVIESGRRALHVVSSASTIDLKGEPVAVQPMRLNGDALSDLVVLERGAPAPEVFLTTPLSTFTVTNINDSGAGSLRQAILDANASPGADAIVFNIGKPTAHTIQPLTALPAIRESVLIDGTTQPGYAGAPVIELDGTAVTDDDGLQVVASYTTIRGLGINRFHGGTAIRIVPPPPPAPTIHDVIVEGDYLGTDLSGTVSLGNGGHGVQIVGNCAFVDGVWTCNTPYNHTIGSSALPGRCLISGNALSGVHFDLFTRDSAIIGNVIGADVLGMTPLPNGDIGGIWIDGSLNITIGGTASGSSNLVSGNTRNGIILGSLEFPAVGTIIQGNRIGTNAAGTATLANGQDGIKMITRDLLVGGTAPGARNLVSGNRGNGMTCNDCDAPTLIAGNYVGTDVSGTSALGNGGDGFRLRSGTATVGTGTDLGRNVISGNGGSGLYLESPSGPAIIVGNFIGTDVNGTAGLGNAGDGVTIDGSASNRLGGTTPGERNVISRNRGTGVMVTGAGATHNVIEGNFIGTDLTGTAALGNTTEGVLIAFGSTNTVGGTTAGARNVVAANRNGITISEASSNIVQGNFVGTDVSGATALPNMFAGIDVIDSSDNTIGGTVPGASNLVSGNGDAGIGVYYETSTGNVVQGNLVGTDASGRHALPNSTGIVVNGTNTMLGGTDPAARNVVSGNLGHGVVMGSGSGNRVFGNIVGADAIGASPLGNGLDGIWINASSNFIGEVLPGGGNTITANGRTGVSVHNAASNAISGNSIYGNESLGIDLDPEGVTPNDPGDADAGANDLQNFPVLTAASCDDSVIVEGVLKSAPLAKFNLEFYTNSACDPSGYGEGQALLGVRTSVPTDSSGVFSFSFTFPGPVPPGTGITATAIDVLNNTSEFSGCVKVVGTIPGEVKNLHWSTGTTTSLEWIPVPSATYYNVYKGVPANLPNLLNTNLDSCLLYSGPATTTGPIVTETPPPGFSYWFLARAANACGEGPAGDALANGGIKPRIQNSSGWCATLTHDKCVTGEALVSTCDVCVARICAVDESCCSLSWDGLCAIEVLTLCNSLSCPIGSCPHALCAAGTPLQPNCDAPDLGTSCVSAICRIEPNCCLRSWDSVCINLVDDVCGRNCI
jgi:hypothetical protein